jgi:hypothetical protein
MHAHTHRHKDGQIQQIYHKSLCTTYVAHIFM